MTRSAPLWSDPRNCKQDHTLALRPARLFRADPNAKRETPCALRHSAATLAAQCKRPGGGRVEDGRIWQCMRDTRAGAVGIARACSTSGSSDSILVEPSLAGFNAAPAHCSLVRLSVGRCVAYVGTAHPHIV